MTRETIGLTEKVTLVNGSKRKTLTARIDTGATQSSVHTSLAKALHLGPVVSTKLVKSSHGKSLRAVIKAECTMRKKKIHAQFNIADRSTMKYKILIGRNALRQFKFLIDPTKD